MSFGKTTLRRWLPAAALALALLCPLPVFAARAGAEIPVTVRTGAPLSSSLRSSLARVMTRSGRPASFATSTP